MPSLSQPTARRTKSAPATAAPHISLPPGVTPDDVRRHMPQRGRRPRPLTNEQAQEMFVDIMTDWCDDYEKALALATKDAAARNALVDAITPDLEARHMLPMGSMGSMGRISGESEASL